MMDDMQSTRRFRISGIKLRDTMAILKFATTEKMFWWGMIIIVEQAIQKKL